jgi:stage III sporulation protein AF
MINSIRQFVENIIVIMILAAFLQMILPEGGMRRYVQLALGLIMVLTLLTPLVSLAQNPFSVTELLGQATLQTNWEELRVKGKMFQEKNDQVLLENYRQVLSSQVKQLLEQQAEVQVTACQFDLVEDRDAEDFGRIRSLQVEVAYRKGAAQPVSSVQPVSVGQQPSGKMTPATEAENAARQAETATLLAKHFALSADQVTVINKGGE